MSFFGDTIHLLLITGPRERRGPLSENPSEADSRYDKGEDRFHRYNDEYRSRIIIIGDFNATPEDREINLITGNMIPAYL